MILLAGGASYGAERIWQNIGKYKVNANVEQGFQIDSSAISGLYRQFYVLYAEAVGSGADTVEEVKSLFLEDAGNEDTENAAQYILELLSGWETDGSFVEYYYTDGTREKTMAGTDLSMLLAGGIPEDVWSEIQEYYQYCIVLSVNRQGDFFVDLPYSTYENADAAIVRTFYNLHQSESLEDRVWWNLAPTYGAEVKENVTFQKLQPFQVVFAVPHGDHSYSPVYYYSYSTDTDDIGTEGTLLFLALIVCMFFLVIVMRSKKVTKDTTPERMNRKGICYFAEIAVFGLFLFEPLCWDFLRDITAMQHLTYRNWQEDIGIWGNFFFNALWIELIFFFCFWFLRPLFTLGIKEYLRQYSLLCLMGRWVKKKWKQFTDAIDSMDFSKKSSKLLLKIVLVNFLILVVCVSCWFVGILPLVIYSVVLFCFLKSHFDKAAAGYDAVLQETRKIAEGELSAPVEGEFGMFAPLGEELGKVKEGFGKAVEKEVKSERMKTELITNVSHDLKTPLTAIMTYVELLKKEDITEEERASYIETLENKSKRLKVLIEDLFEVSRAASNNLNLNLMDVDLVQMVKQVAVEYEEKFAGKGLTLRQNMTMDRVIVRLDGQKTSRIFENLFTNICKYAMPDSRVYAEVAVTEGNARVTLKNISAEELTVSAEEIVERFVRGDASRNTEGSGLGLAIAKNLTEAQGGSFAVDIDGDLFKVEIAFPIKEEKGTGERTEG
ncbi:MAG: HAMP domain-containing histidine kinase [Lachnospiraceae bacterium]|nr:HAMP domain-containing histidine kinase [Lachnospiraceae bacterium]